NKKKVVVTEATIKEALHLDDAEGVECLPNEEIFAELARMGYEKPSTKLTFYKAFFSSQWKFLVHTILQCMSAKRTSWNEFSSSMASAVICLSSEQQVAKERDAKVHGEEVNAGDTAEGDVIAAHGEGRMIAEMDQDADVVLEDDKEVADEVKEVAKDAKAYVTAVSSQVSAVCSIKYALTVNPNIYVSCIKQFWTTVAVKKVNDVIRLQALVDKKKVVVTEATIQEALRLDDAKGVECLPNEEIFTELARMGYEKPSTKLIFYKAFFSSQWKVGKGFSEVETPLFEGMLVEHQVAEEGDVEVHGDEVSAGDTAEGDISAAHGEVQLTPPQSPQHLEFDKVAQALEITKLKRRVKKLERRNKVKVLKLKWLQKVGTIQRVETSNETMMDDVSNQRRMIVEIDQDADVVLEDDKEVADEAKEVAEDANVDESVDIQGRKAESQAKIYKIDLDHANKLITEVVTASSETINAASTNITAAEAQVLVVTFTAAPARVTATPSRRRKGVVIRDLQEESTTSTIIPTKTKSKDKGKRILVEEPKPLKKKQQIKQVEKYARELQAKLNKNIDWDKAINHVKKKAKEDHAVKMYQVLKRKPHTEAQARKNMMVYLKNVVGFKMDYFKKMSYDDMRPIFEAKCNTNKNQRSVHGPEKVKGWKLLESCGVQIMTFTTTRLILLVERKYPLTRFTLDQMLNAVRLEVKEESEVSLELLRLMMLSLIDAAKSS
nr:xylulose kinase-1 [Tanacetum cinerariifolium]